jgi:hypothetical protein
LPELHVYVHVVPDVHEGVPVLVLQVFPQPLQLVVELSCVSQPALFGAVVTQSPQPEAQPEYVHVLPSGQAAPLLCVVSHVTPQAPQLLVVVSLMHAPPQSICPAGHWHTPDTQLEPLGQTFPQLPQLLLSVCSLTQAPPQAVKLVLHANVHEPPTHAGVAFATFVVHVLLHAPHCDTVLT